MRRSQVSPDVAALNPHLFGPDATVAPSPLAAKFMQMWKVLGGPLLVVEFRFDPKRRWRADYCHEPTRTLIELEGGIWKKGGGRHNRAVGFVEDCIKYNRAWVLGYGVFRLATGMANPTHIEPIIEYIRQREEFPY